jgi:hypothetical protein
MNLKIGILGSANGWKLLLQQIGLPHNAVKDTLKLDEFSVVVASNNINKHESEMLRRYLTQGGAVLCSIKVYSSIRPMEIRSMNVDFFSARDSVFNSVGIIDIAARCWLAQNANSLNTGGGVLAAYTGMDKECIVALPFDADEMVRDTRTAMKSFYSTERRLPFERVSLVSKGEIRALVSDCLEFLHHRRGLPYVHLWHFPDGARSVFCFRIDTDYGTEGQMKRLYSTIHRSRIPATWFVDVKSHEKSLHSYSKMRRQEISVHCYEHRTFQDYERNIQNIRSAQEILRTVKLNAKGFAAPYGIWNEELGRVIADCGFEYSSEFSYDYDNLPSRPRFQSGEGVLQIPIHPICIGSLKRHGYSEKQMIRYFANVIQRKLALYEPVIFYHHPRDEHLGVIEWLFEEIRKERVLIQTMNEYARWWKKRVLSIPSFRYMRGNVYLHGVQSNKSLYVRITQPNGTQAIIPASKQIMLEKIRWHQKTPAWIMPDDYLRTRHFNYRIPLIYTLDAVSNFLRRIRR